MKNSLTFKWIILLTGILFLGNIVHPTLCRADDKEGELFLVAQKAFDDGFYDVAIRYIEQFLTDYPQTQKRVQAQLLLGQCYFFKTQYLKAYDIFHQLLSFSEYQDATLFWLGETYFKGSDYTQATKHYQQLIDVYPESEYIPQALYSLGWTYFEQAKYPQAKEKFLTMLKKYPAHQLSEDAAFKLAESEYNLGSYETASQYFQNYILRFPQSTRHADAYFYIAEANYYLEDYLTAVTYYAKTADIAYDRKVSLMAKVGMGWSYLKLEKYELAQKSFEEAQRESEEHKIASDDIYLGLANLYSETGANEKALQSYTTLIQQFPSSPRLAQAKLGQANIYYALKDYPSAIKGYEEVIGQYSGSPEKQEIIEKAYYGLAWTFLKAGQIDASIQTFEKIMNQSTSKVVKLSALTQIGDAYQDINQMDKAIEVYDRILNEDPDSVYTDYVQFRQGIALLKLNKIEAATMAFQTLQANFPDSKYLPDVQYYLGVAYFKKKEWGQAAEHIEKYLHNFPAADNVFASESKYVLGLSYFNLEEYEPALNTFNDIRQNYPEQTNMLRVAEFNIAKCLYHLGQDKLAIEAMAAIPSKYPQTEAAQDALLWLGDHYLASGEYDQAIPYYEKFIADFPGSEKISLVHYEIGQVYQAQEQLEKALQQYNLIKPEPDANIYAKARLAIADIFAKDVDQQKAIETYQNIAQNSSDFKRDALFKIATIQRNNKEFSLAITSLEAALSAEQGAGELVNAELQFHIGDTYEMLNDPGKAVENYLKIPYLYSKDTPWIVKSYLRIARIFENDEKWEDAKTIYDKIIQYQTEESKYAHERIDWIEQNILKIKSPQKKG